MKFHELAVGDSFLYNNNQYVKVQEVKLNCCKVKYNCTSTTGSQEARQPMDEVEKVNQG